MGIEAGYFPQQYYQMIWPLESNVNKVVVVGNQQPYPQTFKDRPVTLWRLA